MLTTEIAYCPQCILFVFAAMGVYQYVVRDRIRNGAANEDDKLLDLNIEQLDAETQLLLLEMLSADHRSQAAPLTGQPANQHRGCHPANRMPPDQHRILETMTVHCTYALD